MGDVLKFDMFLYNNRSLMDPIWNFSAPVSYLQWIPKEKLHSFLELYDFIENVISLSHVPSWCYIIFETNERCSQIEKLLIMNMWSITKEDCCFHSVFWYELCSEDSLWSMKRSPQASPKPRKTLLWMWWNQF